jgi:Na+-transporting methylmalonyl-CoA/oxaloacetate decarboxylase gamma subunit
MVVFLGMSGVFAFLFLMVGGLRVMSKFINPDAFKSANGGKK